MVEYAQLNITAVLLACQIGTNGWFCNTCNKCDTKSAHHKFSKQHSSHAMHNFRLHVT